jgi:predicted cobalt transporter CbtA
MARQEMPRRQEIASLSQRLLWFVALWLGGVGTLALIAFGLRLWLAPK